MYKYLMSIFLFFIAMTAQAEEHVTKRIPELSNDKVNVWKTIIYQTPAQKLKMHRHDHNRVVVALTDGTLKITNNLGETRYFKLVKSEAYYLTKDKAGEIHSDENIGRHPIQVMVIELKN